MDILEEMSIASLQFVCKKLCLSSDGTKRVLIQRLKNVTLDDLSAAIQIVEEEQIADISDIMHPNIQDDVTPTSNVELQNIEEPTNVEQTTKIPTPINIQQSANIQNPTTVQDKEGENNFTVFKLQNNNNTGNGILQNEEKETPINNNGNSAQQAAFSRGSIAVGSVAETSAEQMLNERELILLKKENELLRRERELLKRENELLKNKHQDKLQTTSGVSLDLIGNFIADYDGAYDATFWTAQLKDLQQTYEFDDNMLRALFALKLVGKAKLWLHSRRNTANEDVSTLLEEFCLTFGTKETKLERRRKFEQRKWEPNENFTDYFNAKMMLAGKLQMDEEELLEYIIDGITNVQIKTQVSMQQHTNTRDLYKALLNVKLPKTTTTVTVTKKSTSTTTKLDIRCFNCNSLGHYAADCGKPRRQPGTCYACGSKEHTVATCSLNKKKQAENNDYNAS
ncbi:uncharacterized protein [Musca autumnalis]|uniref:uncharacterized protein n=1 Tax=Musca autumnalis TaxID=221902 RepID=UPI003CECC4A9